jgi:hypothetical protein
MIKNFDALKSQLRELADVINQFKSEAVQLRLVELVFQGSTEAPEEDHDEQPSKSSRTAARAKASPKRGKRGKSGKDGEAADQGGAKPRSGRLGAASILDQLIAEKFFANKQAIGAIIDHCKAKKARTFKPNELSGPLARFTRDGRLKRDTNKDGQYEYYTT